MKQIRGILLTAVTIFFSLTAYDQATEVTTIFKKKSRTAVMIQIDQSVKITSDALEQRLKRCGLNGRTKKGVTSYKGKILPEISSEKINIYTKVEKGTNNSSLVYMLISKDYNTFADAESESGDSLILEKIKSFLNSLINDANYHYAGIDLSKRLKELEQEEKVYRHLLNEQKDLEKKRINIDTRLVEIQNEISEKKSGIDKSRSKVEELKIKRSVINGHVINGQLYIPEIW